MKTKWLLPLFCVLVISLYRPAAQAQDDVKITPLGFQQGEFCAADRALLFVDPTGVRILTAPGRTVNGSTDPRLPKPSDPSGGVHVLLIDHPHVDHIGETLAANCAGATINPPTFPLTNAAEIASKHNSVVPVGGEMSSFFTQKILDVSGTTPPGCPTTPRGADNLLNVPRSSPCVLTLRGGTVTVTFNNQAQGVKITTIPAFHSAGASRSEVDSLDSIPGPGVAPGLTGYAGSETGYILRFTNGLTVLWTGDSGLISDWATISEFYKPNLAVVHMDGLFTMGPDEAAFAVEQLIRPTTVIPEHINQVSTSGGVVVPNLRLDAFINELRRGKIVVPLSGSTISCDGKGNCTGPGLIDRDRDADRDRSH